MSKTDSGWEPLEPLKPLYRIYVRAGKDRDALRAAIRRFYSGWGIVAESLRGKRDPRSIAEEIEAHAREDGDTYTLYIAGREDSAVVEILEDTGLVNLSAIQLAKKRVRNARLEEIYWGIERARARLRLRLAASPERSITVHLAVKPRLEMLADDQPYADVFLATMGWRKWLARLGAKEAIESSTVILERLAGGKHIVYLGVHPLYELSIPDTGAPRISRLDSRGEQEEGREASINENNVEYAISFYERVSLRLLRDARVRAEEKLGHIDAVVIPWSGGKDSTITLMLARKIFKDIVAVYVDTGVDFPQTREYIEDFSERYSIELIRVRAPVRENISRYGLPLHNNRWCTGLKLEALYEVFRKLGERLLVVTGDRDAESEARSKRPPIRLERVAAGRVEAVVVTPLKQWSTMLIQLYAKYRNIELNPLYEQGFYRLGCYICPALRSWEKTLIRKEPLIAARLLGLPYYHYSLKRLSQG